MVMEEAARGMVCFNPSGILVVVIFCSSSKYALAYDGSFI